MASLNRQALEELFKEYSPRLTRFAARQVGESDAEDIVSESFVAALEHIDELKNPQSAGSWLYSIVNRKCIDHIRRESHAPVQPDSTLTEQLLLPEDYAEDRELTEQVRRSVSSLKPDMRTAVLMYYYEERSVAEVAEALGIKENAAKQKLYQARKKLKKSLCLAGAGMTAVPLAALLEAAFDAQSAAAALKAGAAVGKGALAAKLIGGIAAAAIAVGLPLGLHLSSGDDYPTEDSSIVIQDTTPEPEPTLPDNSLPVFPFIAIPAGAAAFGGLVYYAVKCGAVSKKHVIKLGAVTAGVVIAETALLSGSGMGHNPLTYLAAVIMSETGISSSPIQVQSYPDRIYVFPGPDMLASNRAPSLGMIPITSNLESTPDRLYGYSPSEREYFYIKGAPTLDGLTVSHSAPPVKEVGYYDDVKKLIKEKTEAGHSISSDPREYLGIEFYDLIRSSCSSIEQIKKLEELISEGGEEGLAAALALDKLTDCAATENSGSWRTPEEFEALWKDFKASLKDSSFRLDLAAHIAAVSAVSLWLILRIIRQRSGSRTSLSYALLGTDIFSAVKRILTAIYAGISWVYAVSYPTAKSIAIAIILTLWLVSMILPYDRIKQLIENHKKE